MLHEAHAGFDPFQAESCPLPMTTTISRATALIVLLAATASAQNTLPSTADVQRRIDAVMPKVVTCGATYISIPSWETARREPPSSSPITSARSALKSRRAMTQLVPDYVAGPAKVTP